MHIYLVSEALGWILLNKVRVPSVLHMLDDFFLINPPHDSSGSSLSKVKHCFCSLCIPLSEKNPNWSRQLEFLGITVDSTDMKAFVPIKNCCTKFFCPPLFCWQHHKTTVGLPPWPSKIAMRVIPQGRSFISQLLDMASSVPNLHNLISLDEGCCCSNLPISSHLLNHCNGITFLYDELMHSILSRSVVCKLLCEISETSGEAERAGAELPVCISTGLLQSNSRGKASQKAGRMKKESCFALPIPAWLSITALKWRLRICLQPFSGV